MPRTRGPRRVAVVAFVMLVGLLGGTAMADTHAIDDPNEATGGALDVQRASHGHTESGRLWHKIVTFQDFGAQRVGTLTVWITAGGSDYVVSKFEVHSQETGESAAVTVRRPSPNSVKFIFDESAIGNPGSYRWVVHTYCGPVGCYDTDRAPNVGKVLHTL